MSALGGSTGVIIGRGAVDLGLLNTYVCTYCLVAQFQLVLSLRATIAILYGIVLKGEKKCGYFTKPSISYSSWCTPSLFLFIICIFSRGIQRLALSRSIPIIYICCTKYCWYSTYLFPKSLSFPLREPMMTELMWEKRKDGRDPIVTRDGWWGFYCQYLALCSPFPFLYGSHVLQLQIRKLCNNLGFCPKWWQNIYFGASHASTFDPSAPRQKIWTKVTCAGSVKRMNPKSSDPELSLQMSRDV